MNLNEIITRQRFTLQPLGAYWWNTYHNGFTMGNFWNLLGAPQDLLWGWGRDVWEVLEGGIQTPRGRISPLYLKTLRGQENFGSVEARMKLLKNIDFSSKLNPKMFIFGIFWTLSHVMWKTPKYQTMCNVIKGEEKKKFFSSSGAVME